MFAENSAISDGKSKARSVVTESREAVEKWLVEAAKPGYSTPSPHFASDTRTNSFVSRIA
ncbi:MAG TPA: hypothetical protein VFQ18_00450 [Candidatus Acidoferrum sp.]|nr:hypothetical protein [Candidatus Acidoferrum sp.]